MERSCTARTFRAANGNEELIKEQICDKKLEAHLENLMKEGLDFGNTSLNWA
jgi:hypothetical protein